MLFETLTEKLNNVDPELKTIQLFWEASGGEALYAELKRTTEDEQFWQHPEQIQIMKKFQKIRESWETFHALLKNHEELRELLSLFAHDEAQLQILNSEINAHVSSVARFKISLLLDEPADAENCFLNINAGAGGTESQDWAEMLLRMYVRFAEREGLRADIIDYQAGEGAGIKSATLYIRGTYAYGLLKSEQGVHRLVRISPYDANKRRHTSFAAVLTLPESPDVQITIDEKDLRIDTYRAGGAGGQHVNKTESAVRITHLPTNIVVQCQNERSQRQNKETALKMLMAKLAQREEEKKREQHAAIERKKIEWGSQIRSYVLHPYKMVKDHRTEHESPQPEVVLDGDIMPFIEAFLVQRPDKA